MRTVKEAMLSYAGRHEYPVNMIRRLVPIHQQWQGEVFKNCPRCKRLHSFGEANCH